MNVIGSAKKQTKINNKYIWKKISDHIPELIIGLLKDVDVVLD